MEFEGSVPLPVQNVMRKGPTLAPFVGLRGFLLLVPGTGHSARWSTTLSSKVNLPDTINFGDLCGANLVTQPSDIRGNETLELHRVVSEKSRIPGTKLTLESIGNQEDVPQPLLMAYRRVAWHE